MYFVFPEDGYGYITCSGTSHTQVMEVYTKNPNIIATKHNIFAYVENWSGDIYGADIYVIADSSMKFYYYSTYLSSESLSYDYNIWTDSDWIWDNKTSTVSRGFGYQNINARGGAGYYSLDSLNSYSFSSTTVMN